MIYPVIPAYGATALQQLGHQILWDDAIAQKLSYDQWLSRLIDFRPDIIFLESKTPAIKLHWQIINDLHRYFTSKWVPLIVLMGDHVTALPEESLQNSSVDYVLTGGDYDFMMINLVNHLTHRIALESGWYYRSENNIVNTGKFALKHHNLDTLPPIDRELTQWQLYAYNNTNYKYKPGAYIMSGRDCWWGKCSFCSWTTLYPSASFRTFSVNHTLDEIGHLIDLGVKEIFDDSGTLPIGSWLNDLCRNIIKRGYHRKAAFGCNMRFACLNQDQYLLLKKANFRFILYGLESSNQKTLDLINKKTQVADARSTVNNGQKSRP